MNSEIFGDLTETTNQGPLGPTRSLEATISSMPGLGDVPIHIKASTGLTSTDMLEKAESLHCQYVQNEESIRMKGVGSLLEPGYLPDELRSVCPNELASGFTKIHVINYFVGSDEISIYYIFTGELGVFTGHYMNIVMDHSFNIHYAKLDG